ncbi:carbohydrate-binding protein [Thermincola potens]|uniref:Carbohydrate-binding family 25 protein n=1 Tax=Thermincola potens (strain JR) TaxID=635013 RepID=D5XDA1_THEPJ|nr:carbohydrate-binding protein [Thermincola potens]ADG81749.1 carbohydrate-binding family 25 protein [Thermincola potens JR]
MDIRESHPTIDMRNNYSADESAGVTVYPTPITQGEHINVIYNGLLAKSGADGIWLHYGFGPHNNWHDVKDLKMFKTGRGWEHTFQVTDPTRLNFCFKDSANNWDNNNGLNWSFEIHHGKTY